MEGMIRKRRLLSILVLYLFSVAMVFPFVWMFLSSFKSAADVYSYPPRWLPSSWTMDSYRRVFRSIPFLRNYINSIVTSLSATAIEIAIAASAAYALSYVPFPGRGAVEKVLRSTLFVPFVTILVPLYMMVSRSGLTDTYRGIVLPGVFSAFTLFLLLSFFSSLPGELMDSARMDGAGHMGIFTSVVLPLSSSSMATALLFSFLSHWRNYTWPLVVTNRSEMRTLPVALKYLMQDASSEYQTMMAASTMAMLPVVLTFVFFERRMMENIAFSGIKG